MPPTSAREPLRPIVWRPIDRAWPMLQRSSCRGMARRGAEALTRPRLVVQFVWKPAPRFLDVHSDSGWAGCPRKRKAACNGALLRGAHANIKLSTTLATFSLRSPRAHLFCYLVGGSRTPASRELVARPWPDKCSPGLGGLICGPRHMQAHRRREFAALGGPLAVGIGSSAARCLAGSQCPGYRTAHISAHETSRPRYANRASHAVGVLAS